MTLAISVSKPTVGGSTGTWGTQLNAAIDTMVAGINGVLPTLQASSTAATGAMTAGNLYPVDCSSGTRARTLPLANTAPQGSVIVVRKADPTVNPVVISPSGSDTIDGVASAVTIGRPGDLTLWTNGTNGWVSTGVGNAAMPLDGKRDTVLRRGINSSGGEFGPGALPGVYDVDWHFDSYESLRYLASRGYNTIRLPFLWERIQSTLSGALYAAGIARFRSMVQRCAAARLGVILDLHNYARYSNKTFGEAGGPTQADLVDFWTRMSDEFGSDPWVVGYGLMNEPHDIPASYSSVATLNTWDATTESWVVDAGTVTLTRDTTTVHDGAGSLRGSATVAAGTNVNFRLGNGLGGSTTDYTGGGADSLFCWVYIPVGSPGSNWQANLQVQNSSFAYQNGPFISLTPGQWTRIYVTPPVGTLNAARQIVVQISGNYGATSTQVVYVDTMQRGNVISGARTWETLSQACVTAIRAKGDQTKIYVPGYDWSHVGNWSSNHPKPWITDPADNYAYEGHHYWDAGSAGTYPNSYATENASSSSAGFTYGDNLTTRVLTELQAWIDWLSTAGASGFVGEVGWPNVADTVKWNALADRWYDMADAARIDVTAWATGEWWNGTAYNLNPYGNVSGVLATPLNPAAVLEKHQTPNPITATTVTTRDVDFLRAGSALDVVGVFNASSLANKQSWKAAGGTHVVVQAIWDQLQLSAGAALDATALAALHQQFTDAAAAGLRVLFEAAFHYVPSWAASGIPQFKDQAGVQWSSGSPGMNVRDWVWTQTGWDYVRDFQAKVWAQLTPVERALIDTVRVGVGHYGETQFPPVGSTNPYQWWGFSAAAQSGTGIASDQGVCPVPGYSPFTGNVTSDGLFVAWYRASMTNRLRALVSHVRAQGWTGRIHVLHPSYGVRSNWTSSDAGYREQNAMGVDWGHQMAYGYPDAHTWPWSTWVDGGPGFAGGVVDSDKEPWRYLAELARKYRRGRYLWGENTGGQTNAQMDAVFRSGALAGQYTGIVWLDWGTLNAGGSNATLANLTSRLAEHRLGGPAVTGSRSGNAALANLLQILTAKGIITDQSTA